MDIFSILNSIGIDKLENIFNLVSSLFNHSQTSTENINTNPQDFDSKNPYWSLPTYNLPSPQTQSTENTTSTQTYNNNMNYVNSTMQQNYSTMQNQNGMHSTLKSNKNIDFLEIFKVLLPLFKNSNNTISQTETAAKRESEILKLNKTN